VCMCVCVCVCMLGRLQSLLPRQAAAAPSIPAHLKLKVSQGRSKLHHQPPWLPPPPCWSPCWRGAPPQARHARNNFKAGWFPQDGSRSELRQQEHARPPPWLQGACRAAWAGHPQQHLVAAQAVQHEHHLARVDRDAEHGAQPLCGHPAHRQAKVVWRAWVVAGCVPGCGSHAAAMAWCWGRVRVCWRFLSCVFAGTLLSHAHTHTHTHTYTYTYTYTHACRSEASSTQHDIPPGMSATMEAQCNPSQVTWGCLGALAGLHELVHIQGSRCFVGSSDRQPACGPPAPILPWQSLQVVGRASVRPSPCPLTHLHPSLAYPTSAAPPSPSAAHWP